jgi:hypothetical protein
MEHKIDTIHIKYEDKYYTDLSNYLTEELPEIIHIPNDHYSYWELEEIIKEESESVGYDIIGWEV